ncbi:hypothetical protein TNCV_4299801 [Trichonephila clavipes]|nr:hypothetical protein TNCV_4299801 [Trichonephila clavipes]
MFQSNMRAIGDMPQSNDDWRVRYYLMKLPYHTNRTLSHGKFNGYQPLHMQFSMVSGLELAGHKFLIMATWLL